MNNAALLPIRALTSIFAGALLLSAECANGTRPVTPEEAAFQVQTLTMLKNAVPAPPAGWALLDRNVIRVPRSVCAGGEKQPRSTSYHVTYHWLDGAKEAMRQVERNSRQVAELRALPPEKAKEVAELSRHARELQGQAQRSRAEGNVAEGLALEKESAELGRAAAAIKKAHAGAVQHRMLALIQEQQAHPRIMTEVRYHARVNHVASIRLNSDAQPVDVPGATAAFQSGSQTVVVVGPAAAAPKSVNGSHFTEIVFAVQSDKPPTAVQNVVVTFDGPPERVKPLLSGMSATSIKTLIAD